MIGDDGRIEEGISMSKLSSKNQIKADGMKRSYILELYGLYKKIMVKLKPKEPLRKLIGC